MKTLLINASPKKGDSASRRLLEIVRQALGESAEQIGLHSEHLSDDHACRFAGTDQWVFFFPLYVDALPSHLLSCLVDLKAAAPALGPATVYGVVNCGFFEGEQTRFALEVLANWSAAAGLAYGGGLGIGGGGAVRSLPVKTSGPLGPVVRQLKELAGRLREPDGRAETAYANLAFPRALYKAAGEADWRHQIRQNGGRRRDLWNRPDAEA